MFNDHENWKWIVHINNHSYCTMIQIIQIIQRFKYTKTISRVIHLLSNFRRLTGLCSSRIGTKPLLMQEEAALLRVSSHGTGVKVNCFLLTFVSNLLSKKIGLKSVGFNMLSKFWKLKARFTLPFFFFFFQIVHKV